MASLQADSDHDKNTIDAELQAELEADPEFLAQLERSALSPVIRRERKPREVPRAQRA